MYLIYTQCYIYDTWVFIVHFTENHSTGNRPNLTCESHYQTCLFVQFFDKRDIVIISCCNKTDQNIAKINVCDISIDW